MSGPRASSPASTGGAGTFFEQHLAAYWLAQLLVRGIPPILVDTVVAEVRFQTKHLGWHTDDFLVVGERASGGRKLAGQVKRSFTVSATDDECKKAIQGFWKDFKDPDRFLPADDRLVLVTLRGTNTLLEHFAGLLDCARASRDGAEFEQRLATEGFISRKAVQYCNELRKIIGDLDGPDINVADTWPFLRVLHVLSLDLDTPTRQHEAHIRSLLALTAKEGDPVGVAGTTWNALLAVAGSGMQEARSFQRADLPQELLHQHTSIGPNEHRVLLALKDHTAPILHNIRSTIGPAFHLKRAALVQQALVELESSQVVMIEGPAGSGKSAVGKHAISLLSADYFAFAFRAEEFALPHFDAALHAGQIPANWATLAAILAGQDRKVVLIESMERLLEAASRDAFSDLMTLAASDPSLHIILTCRDYSADLVRASFLRSAGIEHAVVKIPPLADAELTEVEAALPTLGYPLKNPALREILRNPYFLDKAIEIPWSADRPLPVSEREFRKLFWGEIVRADQRVAAGMGRRREDALQQIAVRRARSLSAYVTCNDLDPAVVDSLRHDSLIACREENTSLVAPAHDALEDWAILHWIEEQHLTDEGSFCELAGAIGPHPAVRRSYRKWVAELVDRDPAAADRLFTAAIEETKIGAQFRDDTLVSLLKAPSASPFLAQHETDLLANGRVILKRVMHLLRVACVTTPAWLGRASGHGSIFDVPDGTAWPMVLRIVHHNIGSFTPKERPLLLGLIEDAVRNVTWRAPELEGAEFVAGVAHWLLVGFEGYKSGEQRKRALRVIAKIPKADAARFEALLRGSDRDQGRDRTADDLREIVFTGVDGMPAARDLPDAVISVATSYLLASEDDLRKERFFMSSLDLHTHFGIKEGLDRDFSPASAIRGPWVSLLRYHRRKALALFMKVFNHSAEWYAHPRVHDRLEPAFEINLTLADGTTRKQWGNPRLWNLYRGISVGPSVLQSLLMALEKTLLELGAAHPGELDSVLMHLLHESDSASVAAVVASVATAYPHASGEALLALLSAPTYLSFDRGRMASESQAPSTLHGMFPQLRADSKVYEAERQEADRLPHRRRDLETAIANLQLGRLAPRVHALLDQHLAALPPKAEQDESHRVWRLALHRMDLRQYKVSEKAGPEVSDPEARPGEPTKRFIWLEPRAPESDVQEMIDKSAARLDAANRRSGLLMWGVEAFEREKGGHDPSQWRERLIEAQALDREAAEGGGGRNGPGIVAAVCARDHWEDMSTEEREWCVDLVCAEIARQAENWAHFERVQRFPMAADRPCASVVPLLLGKALNPAQRARVREALAAAITHAIDEVRWYASWGIDGAFWASDRRLAMRCVNAIAMEAGLIDKAWEAEEGRPYDERRSLDEITAEIATAIRQRFWEEGAIAEDAYMRVDISGGFAAGASGRMLAILGEVPGDPAAVAAFARASRTLVEGWDAADDHWTARYDGRRRRERNFENEAAVSTLLQRFVMRTSPAAAREVLRPLVEAIDSHPRETHSIVQGLTVVEDRSPNTPQYWLLWGLLADGVRNAKWVSRLDDEHPFGSEMLAAIFLTSYWKDDVRHWRSLDGHAHHVHELFEALPPSAIVLEDYVRFLYHIGERSLPEAFLRISCSLRRGDAESMLRKTDTVFLLEVLLQRHVYGRPLELKRERAIREAVLFLLDTLVDSGSSASFRMRDDFVTPTSV